MEVEHTEIITIINNNFDLCNYFNKFPQISNATIKIGNKNVLINKDMIMKFSTFFNDFISDNPKENVYILQTEYPANFVEKVISYLYGCDLMFNINYFYIYYKISDYLMIDQLTNSLRENLREGFENRKYDVLQALRILTEVFYIKDDELNNILLITIANNFMSLREQLKFTDINILQTLISRDDLNINSEQEIIFFLNYYYAIHQNNEVEIDQKLIPNIRMLTLSIDEINNISILLLSELSTYKKLVDKSLLSKKEDNVFSKAHLIINYKNISIPRISIVINEFNNRKEITNYYFGTQEITGFKSILPIFPAIIINDFLGRINLKLQILNAVIYAKIKDGLDVPKVGSMILITNSVMIEESTRHPTHSFGKCLINKYNILFERVPDIFYK